MKITAIETIRLEEFANILWIRVHTDESLVGLGETFFMPRTVEAYVHEVVAPKMLGRDPLAIDRIAKDLTGYVGFRSTGVEMRGNSAFDIALWDLMGKACGQPVSRLLGGDYRRSVQPYGSILYDEHEPLKKTLADVVARGFKAIKLGWRPFGRRSDRASACSSRTTPRRTASNTSGRW